MVRYTAPRKPSLFDIALCLVVLRSQPRSLDPRGYIHLLRSLTSNGRGRAGRLRHLDATQGRDKLMECYIEEITELRAKVLELEAQTEKEGSQRVQGGTLQAQTTEDVCTSVKRKRGDAIGGAASMLKGNSNKSKEYVDFEEIKGNYQRLQTCSDLIPHLLNAIKISKMASEPQLICHSIGQICDRLTEIVQQISAPNGYRGNNANNSNYSKTQRTSSEEKELKSTISLILRLPCEAIKDALNVLYDKQANMQVPAEFITQGGQQFMEVLCKLMLAIYDRTVMFYQVMLLTEATSQSSTQKHTYPNGTEHVIMHPTSAVDCRPIITKMLIRIIPELKSEKSYERQIVEGLTCRLLSSLGSLMLRTENVSEPVMQPAATTTGSREKRKVQAEKLRAYEMSAKASAERESELEQSMMRELAKEETAWFWLDILDCLLRKHWENHQWVQLQSLAKDGRRQDFIIESGSEGRLLNQARKQLKDYFLNGVVGQEGNSGTRQGNSKMEKTENQGTEAAKGQSKISKYCWITSVPALYELWTMIGLSELDE
ncbi:hypothetical protein DFH27DRAFT_520485 [Peziza echinospora]|nr:hypothetical protein DFH27DRAFT_520485 [Peziza echinospora]